QAAVVAGFQRHAVVGRHLGQGGGGGLVLQRRVLLLAQRQQRGGVAGGLGDGGFQALQPLVRSRRGGAANVVLKRAEPHPAGGCQEGLLRHGKVRVHAL